MTAPPTASLPGGTPYQGWPAGPGYQPWSSRQRSTTGAPIAVLVGLAVLAGVVLLASGAQHPIGLVIAVPLSAIAMGIVLSFYLWLDRWEPEPTRLLLLAFLWGATVAVLVSLALELASSEVLGNGLVLTLVGPAIEEAAKGAFLLVMLTGARRNQFDGVIDGLVYAGVTAIGFAFIEDIGYIAQTFGKGNETTVAVVVLRLVMAPFAHPLFTSLTGLGFGLAVSRPQAPLCSLYPVSGYLGAVALHALWNTSLRFGLLSYLLVYLLIMVPVLGGVILLARHHRQRERDVVRRQLPAMVHYGWLTPAEAGWLASIAARRLWLRNVRARSGAAGVQALRSFQQAATELAFLRDRVERGVGPPQAYYLHAELVQALARNRALALRPLAENPRSAGLIHPAPPAHRVPPAGIGR